MSVPSRIAISPQTSSLHALGQTVQLTTKVFDQNGNAIAGANVKWTSSAPNVASVSDSGLVTAVMNGTATITASAGDASATVTVTVMQAAVRIVITPEAPILHTPGQTVQLTAEVFDQNDSVIAGADVRWTSAAPNIVSVSDSGLVTAVMNGTATITATAGDVNAAVTVTVTQSAGRIVITPEAPILHTLGQTVQLTAEVFDQNGNAIAGANVKWTSSAPNVASVSDLGLVTAVMNGTATITASAGDDVAASITVTVTQDTDREVLIAFYNSLGGPKWARKFNWLSEEPIDRWGGVSTDPGGRVIKLELGHNGLSGSIPAEIGELSNLRFLDLGWNRQIVGNIPSEIGDLVNLRYLDLSVNKLSGEIPPEVGQLKSLETLLLYHNHLSGAVIPEIGQLKSLVSLDLATNQLTGEIPPELGQISTLGVLKLGDNQLTGEIPSEIGKLRSLKELGLSHNRLSGGIPPEFRDLSSLTYLRLGYNLLTGEIPPEIGKLRSLRYLDLAENRLTGDIPSEIWAMNHLQVLILIKNQFTGGIPPEIGQMDMIEHLSLWGNPLKGDIPAEIGQLNSLTYLDFSGCQLTGKIPAETGKLSNLELLAFHKNQLSGRIPPEIGLLDNLVEIYLHENRLTGGIPSEIGKMSSIEILILNANQLSGNIPPEIGQIESLRHLNLSHNEGLSGPIPIEITALTGLVSLILEGTQLCAPRDSPFEEWLTGIESSRVLECEGPPRSVVYLTQATQSLSHPVPLVAGEDALLRVFVAAPNQGEASMPPVRATFYQDGSVIHEVETRAEETKIPSHYNEGSLAASANAIVPGSVIMPGLELVVEIDPDDTLRGSSGLQSRIPDAGSMRIEVNDVPGFDLKIIPFLWTEDPDYEVVTRTEGLTKDDNLFRLTRDLLPIRDDDFSLTVSDPVLTSVDPHSGNKDLILNEVDVIRTMEGGRGHYMGILRDGGGQGEISGRLTVAGLYGDVIAHELGHNMSLFHAPCGTTGDVNYPYRDGSIGAWGYDMLNNHLVSPDTPDIMGYCGPPDWISDYNFTKALRYRVRKEELQVASAYGASSRGLLVWGGVQGYGNLVLQPAFAVSARPSLPQESGPYQIEGEDDHGNLLFSLSFDISQFADGEGGSFVFILPMRADWSTKLAGISLSGPEGFTEIDNEGERSAALLLDRNSGKVRGILRDQSDPPQSGLVARRVLPESGLEFVISRGVPGQDAWKR